MDGRNAGAPRHAAAAALARLGRYARTARHLRPEQLATWPLRRVQRALPSAIPRDHAPPDARRVALLARCVETWGPDGEDATLARADAVRGGTFRFLGHAEPLGAEPPWGTRVVSHLWSYNLHYFDYALDLAWAARISGDGGYARRLESLALGWIRATRPGAGDAWDPYAISVRVPNWVYALALLGDALDAAAADAMWRSAWTQLRVLERRLERHLQANHLQRNFRALALGGLVYEGTRAAAWARRHSAALWAELREQVLPDGGHYERSPMYHAAALADFLECAAAAEACGQPLPRDVPGRLQRMLGAYAALSRADGSLHLFNDAADGVAPSREAIARRARAALSADVPAATGGIALPDTGYWGVVSADGRDRLVVDGGEPGPAHQPGHAHCDLLSFELDLRGRRVVVDSGTSGYAGDPLRAYQRSTRAHNTVAIGGREQSEVWGVFRVGGRASVVAAEARWEGETFAFEGAYRPWHDGRAVHRREIRFAAGALHVEDVVDGAPGAELTSYVHFHPDFAVTVAEGTVTATSPDLAISLVSHGVDGVRVAVGEREPPQGWYSPSFGVRLAAPVVELRVARNAGRPFGYVLRAVEPSADAAARRDSTAAARVGARGEGADLAAGATP